MTTFQLYLLTRLPELHSLFVISSVVLIAAIVITGVFYFSTICDHIMRDEHNKAAYILKRLSVGALISCTLSCLIPSKEDMAIIIVGKYITNNAEIAKLPDNVAATLNAWLEEARPKVEEKK